jgi:tetratricopeptide (TPR) repeat protein
MSDATRRRRHRSLAHVVEELFPDDPGPHAATLARHFDLGGEPARAAGYFLLAAQRALALYADEEALELASAGRDRSTDPEGRFALVGLLETVYARRGDRARQSDALAAMQTEASGLTAEEECEVLLRWIHLHRALGEREAEGSRIDDLVQRSDGAGLRLWQTRALQARATWLTERGDYEPARAIAQQALDRFAADGDTGGQVESLCSLAEVSVLQGDFDAVTPLVERALHLATAESNQSLVVHCLRAASAGAFARQDFAASIALGTRMEELCRRIGDLEGEADALTRLGSARARLFLVDQARRHYAEAARLYRRLGKRQGEGAVLINAGFLLTWLGLYDEARASYENADAIFRAIDDRRGQAISLLNLGMVELYQSHPGPAREAAGRALELARRMESPPMIASALANLGAAERDLGETRTAIEHMQEGLALRRSLGQRAEMANDLSDLAIAYLDDGLTAEARTACEEMLRLLEESPDSVMHPQYVLWTAAQTSWAEGEEAKALRLLEEAGKALSTKATAIPDDVSRQAFLTLPFNRELAEALHSGRWPRGRTTPARNRQHRR